jgi:hypothetical protein
MVRSISTEQPRNVSLRRRSIPYVRRYIRIPLTTGSVPLALLSRCGRREPSYATSCYS